MTGGRSSGVRPPKRLAESLRVRAGLALSLWSRARSAVGKDASWKDNFQICSGIWTTLKRSTRTSFERDVDDFLRERVNEVKPKRSMRGLHTATKTCLPAC